MQEIVTAALSSDKAVAIGLVGLVYYSNVYFYTIHNRSYHEVIQPQTSKQLEKEFM